MTEVQRISVAQALLMIKRTKVDIERFFEGKGPNVMAVVSTGTGENYRVPSTSMNEAQVKEGLIANWKSYTQLRKNLTNLQRAVVLSNATTKIKFDGEEITLVEAIELRKQIAYDKTLIDSLMKQANLCNASYNAKLEEMNKEITRQKTEITARTSLPAETVQQVIADIEAKLKAQMAPKIEDPNEIEKRIAELNERLLSFMTELDFLVNTSNVQTMIDVVF